METMNTEKLVEDIVKLARVPKPEPEARVVNGIKRILESWFSSHEAKMQYKLEKDKELLWWKDDMKFDEWKEYKIENLDFNHLPIPTVSFPIGLEPIMNPIMNLTKVSFEFGEILDKRYRISLYDKISEYLYNVGWAITNTNGGMEPWHASSCYITIEPFYGNRIGKIPNILYFMAAGSDIQKILKRGIITNPKVYQQSDDTYTAPTDRKLNRIYLKIKYDQNQIGNGYEDEYFLLEIDSSKLRKGTKFYNDVRNPSRLYTYTSIPPEAIKLLNETRYKEYLKEKEEYEKTGSRGPRSRW